MRLIVADDSLLFREGLVRLLCEQEFEVLAQGDNAEDLVRRVGGLRPDAALVDIRMPPTFTDEGLRAALEIGERYPGVGVVVLSQYVESSYAMRLLEHGSAGRGYLLKDRVGDLNGFADAIRRVGDGGSVVDPEVVAALVARRRPAGPLDELTDRERECLALMAEGRSNTGICERVHLSPPSVRRSAGWRKENYELRRANEILKSASVFSPRARPRPSEVSVFIEEKKAAFGIGAHGDDDDQR